MTVHVEQTTPEDTALPVWVIYEGEEWEPCPKCRGQGDVHGNRCHRCGGSGDLHTRREIARATSEADAERVRAALDKSTALYAGYSAKCERWSLGTCDVYLDGRGPCRICAFFTDLGYESFDVTRGGLRSWRPPRCPLCHHSIHDHAPDCKALHIGQVGC